MIAGVCENELNKHLGPGETPAHIDTKQVEVHKYPPEKDLRSFMISYRDARKDFTCVAQVLWSPTHELLDIQAKNPGESSFHSLKVGTPISDACTMTEKFAGPEEFAGQVCQDDFVDPRLKNAYKKDGQLFDSAKDFATKCRERFEKYGRDQNPPIPDIDKHLRSKMGDDFVWRQSRIVNPVPGKGRYALLFETYAHNFSCVGEVDWTNHPHEIVLQSEAIQESQNDEPLAPGKPETAEPDDAIEMHDACSFTRALFGNDKEVPYNCQDLKTGERMWKTNISNGLQVGSFTMLVRNELKNKTIANLMSSPRTPEVVRLLGNGVLRALFGGLFFDDVAGVVGFDEDHYVRKYGKWLAGILTMFVPKISPTRGLFGYVAFDTAARAIGLSEDNPVRKHGKWFAGAASALAPQILARTSLAARVAASPALSIAGGIASRVAWFLVLVQATDYLSGWMEGDYEASLNERATEQIYEDSGLNHWWNPLAWINIPRSLRLIMPNAINSYTANMPDIHDGKFLWESHQKKQFREEDQQRASVALLALQTIMPQLLHPDNEHDEWGDLSEEVKTSIALLQKKIEFTPMEQVQKQVIILDPAKDLEEELKLARPYLNAQELNDLQLKLSAQQAMTMLERAKWFNLSDQELENLLNKFYTQKAQEAAATLVFVPGKWSPVVDELFKKDGTLRDDMDGKGNFAIDKARSFFHKDPWAQ